MPMPGGSSSMFEQIAHERGAAVPSSMVTMTIDTTIAASRNGQRSLSIVWVYSSSTIVYASALLEAMVTL